MTAIPTFAIYAAAALAEIAGCFAVWAWLRLGASPGHPQWSRLASRHGHGKPGRALVG